MDSQDLSQLVVPTGETLDLEGEIDASVFHLPGKTAAASSPLRYSLQATHADGVVVVNGSIRAGFSLECVRCCTHFPHEVVLDPYLADIELENSPVIDLTDRLREDILLALPAYPRCDQGSEPRTCPVGDRYSLPPADSLKDVDGPAEDPDPGRSGQWGALESWKPPDHP